MARIANGWLHCEVLCHDRKLDELGVDNSLWLPASIKIAGIVAYREHRPNDQEKDEKALAGTTTVTVGQDELIVDIPYDEFYNLMRNGMYAQHV